MTRPVATRIWGGLGNQLFQYAAGRSMADRLHVPLLLDVSWFETRKLRGFMLEHFQVRVEGRLTRNFDGAHARLRNMWDGMTGRYIAQNRNDDAPSVRHARRGAYLNGYFQCADYFNANEAAIRKDLQLAVPAAGKNRAMQNIIASCAAVSVHVRRSDYLLPQHARTFATCSLDYYQRAAEHLLAEAGRGLTFFVFSDDMAWCRENLMLPGKVVFVDHNDGEHGHEDLRLMAECQHHIIANSTFSWWGAWLNPRLEKIICAPKTWYCTEKLRSEPLTMPSFVLFENSSTGPT